MGGTGGDASGGAIYNAGPSFTLTASSVSFVGNFAHGGNGGAGGLGGNGGAGADLTGSGNGTPSGADGGDGGAGGNAGSGAARRDRQLGTFNHQREQFLSFGWGWNSSSVVFANNGATAARVARVVQEALAATRTVEPRRERELTAGAPATARGRRRRD